MGSSSKASNAKKRELSNHALTLRERLRDALSLGIRFYDKKGRKWECMDAEIQSHALRAMAAFIGCISSSLLQHPLIKDSVSDMLVALEGILQSDNERILNVAANITTKLVSCLGTSICHYDILDFFTSLLRLLSFHQLPVAISSATALKLILIKLGPTRYENYKEVWIAVGKTNAVGSIVRALQDYVGEIQPPEYFSEMASLLKTILWRWPPSRYHVWSNSSLLVKLAGSCASPDSSITFVALQLYSAIALCGDGAMVILENKELIPKMVQCMGASQPYNVRCEALILCQHLMRSAKGCSMLTSFYCEPIIQAIVRAMGGWRSGSKKFPSDEMPLVMEACRTALMTRWPGNHHSYFWNLEIDKVLLDILLGDCNKKCRDQPALSSEGMLGRIYDNNTVIRPYIWDIVGWLAIHCEEDYLPKTTGKLCYLDILISCACSVAKDLMHKGRSVSAYESELEPVSRTLMLMVFSPCKYIASQARYRLSEMARTYSDDYLKHLLTSLKLNASGNVSLVVNLLGLTCYSALPQFQKLIIESKGIHILSSIIKRCLHSDIHISRSSVASHLQSSSDGRTCCWDLVGDWEGGDVLLFYSLQALCMVIVFSENSDGHDLVDSLQCIFKDSFSPGVKWYAAYIRSFFGFYGFPTKLGERMKSALDENEVADLKLVLSNGRSLRVHGAVLLARCPSLLPTEEFSKERDLEQHGRRFRDEVRMSSRVDNCALLKFLGYVYTGIFQVDDDLMKPCKNMARYCDLKSLSDMLHRKLPIWGTADPTYDLTRALGTTGLLFSDIILEAITAGGVSSNCSVCHLSVPHIHAHKIILCSSCDYLRALFQSGMLESYSEIIKVPIGWKALEKLVKWFYSGELPRTNRGCMWENMEGEQQLLEIQAYVELCSVSEYWLLEEVGEESLNEVLSYLKSDQKFSVEIIRFATDLGQGKIVKAAVSSVAPLYPKMRDAGDLEDLDEKSVDMLRAEYVRYSQEGDDWVG